jgi:flagellar basal-body rod protein FlgF
MQTGVYISYSGQIALDRRMATIANNIANAGTIGYRAEELKFSSILSNATSEPMAFASTGNSFISERAGGLRQTGNPLDLAIHGDGYLAIQTSAGTAFTRDGRLKLLDTGELQTLNGNPVLDTSNSPLLVDPANGPPTIARDGTLSQNGKRIATIGLFSIDVSKGYLRGENSSVLPTIAATAKESFISDGFAQSYIEDSNVNAVTEMTNLITVTRSFDRLQTAIEESDTSLKKAIQILAGS